MELRSLIFKVIADICVLIVVIVLLIFGFVCILSGPLCFNNYGFICLFIVTLPCSFFSSAQNIASYVFLGFGLLDIILFRMLMLLIVQTWLYSIYYFTLAVIVFQDLGYLALCFSGFQSFH